MPKVATQEDYISLWSSCWSKRQDALIKLDESGDQPDLEVCDKLKEIELDISVLNSELARKILAKIN